MKKLKLFSIVFLLMSIPIFAQSAFVYNMSSSSERGAISYFTQASVDSVGDTLTTAEILLSNGINNVPIFAKKIFASTAGLPKIKIVRQEYAFGLWRDAKTLYTADSVETYGAFTADTLRADRNRYLIMGVTVNGQSKNRADTIIKFILRFARLP